MKKAAKKETTTRPAVKKTGLKDLSAGTKAGGVKGGARSRVESIFKF